jgi:hypothetical protein
MPIAVVLFAIDVVLIVHAAKTGRFWPWASLILMLPGVGAIAYVAVELAPQWLGSYRGRQAQNRIARALDPGKRYRRLRDELEISDTIANRVALAEECLALRRPEEALPLYDAVLAHPLGQEPSFMVGKARALLELSRAPEAVATLEAMRSAFPHYENGDAHLLYARALETAGRDAEALAEYDELASYYAGAEPRSRRAALLQKLGRDAEARAAAEELVKTFQRAPQHVRRAQAEWIAEARRIARA